MYNLESVVGSTTHSGNGLMHASHMQFFQLLISPNYSSQTILIIVNCSLNFLFAAKSRQIFCSIFRINTKNILIILAVQNGNPLHSSYDTNVALVQLQPFNICIIHVKIGLCTQRKVSLFLHRAHQFCRRTLPNGINETK